MRFGWIASCLSLTACVSTSYGGELSAGISQHGRAHFEARAAGGLALRNLDTISNAQDALVMRAFLLGGHVSLDPRPRDVGGGSVVGGGVDIEPVALTQFWGGVGFAGDVVAGFNFDYLLGSGASTTSFFVRLQLGVEIETTPSDWSIIQGPYAPCARRSHHEILSLLPTIEYRGVSSTSLGGTIDLQKDVRDRSGFIFSLAAGYSALNEACSDGGA